MSASCLSFLLAPLKLSSLLMTTKHTCSSLLADQTTSSQYKHNDNLKHDMILALTSQYFSDIMRFMHLINKQVLCGPSTG